MMIESLLAIGPHFAAELKKAPDDLDGAWRRAVTLAKDAGSLSFGGWVIVPDHLLYGPVAKTAFEIFDEDYRNSLKAFIHHGSATLH